MLSHISRYTGNQEIGPVTDVVIYCCYVIVILHSYAECIVLCIMISIRISDTLNAFCDNFIMNIFEKSNYNLNFYLICSTLLLYLIAVQYYIVFSIIGVCTNDCVIV